MTVVGVADGHEPRVIGFCGDEQPHIDALAGRQLQRREHNVVGHAL
jgi:hypothetical protein